MSQKSIGEIIRERLPRFILSMLVGFLFYIISLGVPPLVEGITVPGINIAPYNSASWLIWAASVVLMMIFFIKGMSDALVLADIGTQLIVRFLGIKEDRPLRRVARDVIYIVLAILLAEAGLPFLALVPRIGNLLTIAVSLVTLGVVIVLIYDIGRILYRMLEERARAFAEWIAEIAERVREGRRG
ncbi:MAG: hypothetical protein ACTSUS_10105 [Candidatus Freyarchaeota archaeon]